MKTIIHRGSLCRMKKAIKEESLRIGFIGGSITAFVDYRSWTEPVINWFVSNFPNLRLFVENAGIEGTGSDLACFRAERDIIERNCDVVFVEYAVNDINETSEKRERSREGLIRKFRKAGIDIVFVYTFSEAMLDDMMTEKMPDSIAEFEKLAEWYNIGSVWMGLHALNEVKRGNLRWEEWIPDRIHPRERGSLCYAEPVIQYIKEELSQKNDEKADMPSVLNDYNWENSFLLPFDELKLSGPWKIRRSTENTFMDQILDTSALGARFSFSFEGRGVYLGLDYGQLSAGFRWRIDGGEWSDIHKKLPVWAGQTGWYHLAELAFELSDGKHEVEVETAHAGFGGTRFNLAMVGIIK